MITKSVIAVIAACVLAWVGWSAKISLSVGVGGVIGLANLWLWQRVVAGIIAQRQGTQISGAALVARMVVKLIPLVVLVAVIIRGALPPVAVMAGFGSALFGMAWSGLFEGKTVASRGCPQGAVPNGAADRRKQGTVPNGVAGRA